MVGEEEQSFLMDTRWLQKVIELASPGHHDVLFLIGGGNGQLASSLGDASRIVTVEPDESIANYLYSLELYHTTVLHADPCLVLGDVPFDKLLCLQPRHLDENILSSMLRVPFSQAVLVMPDSLLQAFRRRDRLGALLRASYDTNVLHAIPRNAFSPTLPYASSLVELRPVSKKDPVASSLRLLLREAGTMRGLLTRSCREFFRYTLAEAQEAVRLLPQDLLKKRFWELSEDEFKDVHEWLKLG
ncbi:hypothetical protein JXA12_04910 [Candidatus Woesearchaeota archaeon]|nr:hypothetical protein [Candidatus Woesearchaeota archaeon]